MASSNRKIIKKLHAKLIRRYPVPCSGLEKNREILEHFVYALFLENASFETANRCFGTLETYFVDWNEVRVSTARELSEVFNTLYEPLRSGERLRRTLQYIFDTLYKFDLESYRPQGAAETLVFLESIPYSTDFINAYVINTIFKMQDVPLDEGSLRVLRLLDLVEVNEKNREVVPALAAALTQAERVAFFSALHTLGIEMLDDSKRDQAIEFLAEIDKNVKERSWIELVDLSEITDPVAIAKKLLEKEEKPKLPLTLAIEEVDDDAVADDIIEGTDDDSLEDEDSFDIDENVDDAIGLDIEETEPVKKKESLRSKQEVSKPGQKEKKRIDKKTPVESASGSSESPSKSRASKSGVKVSDTTSGEPATKKKAAKSVAPEKKKSSPSGKKTKSDKAVETSPVQSSKSTGKTKETKSVSAPAKRAKSTPVAGEDASKSAAKSSASRKKSAPVKKETAKKVPDKKVPEKKEAAKKKAVKKAPPKKETTRKEVANKNAVKKGSAKKDDVKKEATKKEKVTPKKSVASTSTAKTPDATKSPAKKAKSGTSGTKGGPKKSADKSSKVSAAKKLLQKKPH